MKRIQPIVWFVLSAFAASGMAQESETQTLTLTLQQAVKQALANYPTVRIQEYAIKHAQGQKTTAGLLPNPIVKFYREDLNLNGQDSGETIFSAGLPLNFLWSRWSQISAAVAQVDAEQMVLADVQRLVTFEVQKAFAETHYSAQNYLAWQKATNVFKRAAEDSRNRLADGDMAGYEHQRITVEYLRYQKAETEAKVQLNNSRRRLAFLVDPDLEETLIKTSAVFPSPPLEISPQELLAQSIENRPDLQAARFELQSLQAALTANKWRRLPEIMVEGGYKKQVDDFKGAVMQISFGLPLFDRNQGEIRSAQATLDRQTLALELLEKEVALEVRQTYETYHLYRQQVEQFLDEAVQPPEQLLDIAQFSYAEGEMSLLELLDGVRAYIDSFVARSDLLLKYQLSVFDVQRVAGTSITQESDF